MPRCSGSREDVTQLSAILFLVITQKTFFMRETHPFEIFSPPNAKYLILGSFVGKEAAKGTVYTDQSYDWFYGTKRNQFWSILEAVYGIELNNKTSKKELFTRLGIAIADIIYECDRKDNNNLDSNLTGKKYNDDLFEKIKIDNLKKIFFTSKFVEREFKKHFKEIVKHHPYISLCALPSPSPRYALKSKEQKIQEYKNLLPTL